MAATKQRVNQKASKKKATTKATKVGAGLLKKLTKLGKPVFRTTDAKPAKPATAKSRRRNKCLCNCGESTTSFFRRGHSQKFRSNLKALRAGEFNGATPAQVMGVEVAEALGPWTKMARSGGWKPRTSDYTVAR